MHGEKKTKDRKEYKLTAAVAVSETAGNYEYHIPGTRYVQTFISYTRIYTLS